MGVWGGDPGPESGAARGEGPASVSSSACTPCPPARRHRRRGTHGPRHPPRAGLLAPGERRGPRGQSSRPWVGGGGPGELTVAAKADPSAGLEPRGARTGAYTARPVPSVRARGCQERASAPSPSQPRRQSLEPKAEGSHPSASPGSPYTGNAYATPQTFWQQAVWAGHMQVDPVHTLVKHTGSSASQAGEVQTLRHTQLSRAHMSRPQLHTDRHCTHAVGRGWSRQIPPKWLQLINSWPPPNSRPLPLCPQQSYITTCQLGSSRRVT